MQPTMRTVKAWFLLFAFIFCCCNALGANPLANTADINQVIQTALQPSLLETNLHRLTDEIGGRGPGNIGVENAVGWGKEALTVAGAGSGHNEGVAIPSSRGEGETQR